MTDQSLARAWLSVQEAAAYAGLTTRSIYYACGAGHLRSVRIDGKRPLQTRRDWLDTWLEQVTTGLHAES
jgi:excisionase family DNA binding protein